MINKFKKIKGLVLSTAKGFTLIETLIAVLILATAIAGPLTIASKGLQTALIAKDQTTAYYLAQDAVEYMRFVRDTNRLQSRTWLAGLDGTANGHTNGGAAGGNCIAPSSCTIDSLSDLTATCPGGVCSALYYNPTGHNFTYSSGAPNVLSIYTRSISITTPVGGQPDEAQVVVQVSWQDIAGQVHLPVVVRENLYNWQ